MRRLLTLKYLLLPVLAAFVLTSVFYFSSRVGAQNKVVRAGQTDQSYDTTKGDSPMYPAGEEEEKPDLDKSIFQELIDWWNGVDQEEREASEEGDADLPSVARGKISKAEYMKLRGEYIGRLRGIEPDLPFDTTARSRAVNQMQRQESNLLKSSSNGFAPTVAWTEIGPFSVPNGQTQTGVPSPVNGRITAIVVDPTNSNIVYLGTAQGGVWRSNNGGTTWTSIFDNAQTLTVGALAIAPTNHSILYIGTGEPNLCGDCFFGVGVYRIDNADTTTGAAGDLQGPINPTMSYNNAGGAFTAPAFSGRSISQIAVSPTDPATIFVGTSTGASGSGGSGLGLVPNVGLVGLYRSTNATSAPGSVTFQKLGVTIGDGTTVDLPNTGSRRISDVIFEPGNPNNLLVSTFGAAAANDGGIFRTTNALAPSPTFTQTYTISTQRIRFAIQKTGAIVTVLAATSETSPTGASCAASTTQLGIVRRSVDGGVTFPTTNVTTAAAGGVIPTSGGYCGGQCFYNVTVAVNPTNANDMYLGGNARGTCSDAMKHSTDGIAFARDDTSVHADSHALAYSADGNFIYYGNDGGIWRRAAQTGGVATPAGTAWTDSNTNPLNMFQFVSLAVHPTDQNFTIGGTQDNGTEAQNGGQGNWVGAEGGDGGYALIDQSSTDTVNVTMYHTFYNQTSSLIGFDRATLGLCLATKDSWASRGFGFGTSAAPACDGTAKAATNGIVGTDAVLFYAPMELGPGTPNTLYFGTSRLYRSTNRGDTMTTASQIPISGTTNANGSPISTIAVSPKNDNLRMVGLQNGQVWGTSTGSNTLVNITSAAFPANPTGSTTNKFVGRARITPTNPDVAYVTFSFYAPAGQGVWKITNYQAATSATPAAPVWTAAGSGIPSVPINAFVVDPVNENYLYAGTDIGVYFSTDAGATWNPFGTGLPKVSVFDLAIQPTSRLLRAATHGRGMWEIPIPYAPTAAAATVGGRALTAAGRAISGARISLTDQNGKARTALTSSFGYYSFNGVPAGQTYVVSATAKGYRFGQSSQVINLSEDLTGLNFIAN